MNTSASSIVDDALPETQNFAVLKSNALRQIKQLAGATWTNFNDNDPGVTILDQLCYALTELGYCNQFSIADILTRADGKIQFKDQFFQAQEILTCSPITLDDYRKLILDRVDEIRAIYLYPEQISSVDQTLSPVTNTQLAANCCLTGRYFSYLYLKRSLSDDAGIALTTRVNALLNQHRNLAELFLAPAILKPAPIQLTGTVHLTQSADAQTVYHQIQLAFDDYVAPLVVQSGYQQLQQQGLNANQILNGPQLQNGWINGAVTLTPKCDCVSLFDLGMRMARIDGVSSVANIAFTPSTFSKVIGADSATITASCISIAQGATTIAQGAASIASGAAILAISNATLAEIAASIANAANNIANAAASITTAAMAIVTDISQLGSLAQTMLLGSQSLGAGAVQLTAGANWLAQTGAGATGYPDMSAGLALIAQGANQIAPPALALGNTATHIAIPVEQIAQISLSPDFIFQRNATTIAINPGMNQVKRSQQSIVGLTANHAAASVDAAVNLSPPLPTGNYRDIEQYYSIQNTFPDNYHVGENTLPANASAYQIAQIRQLKAYLTVYDQLLANQFSQLAHIGELFSFTSDKGQSESYLHPGQGTRHKLRDPLPQQKFVNTYFCQPLYQIPEIQPLLRGHDTFHYQFDPNTSDQIVAQRAWDEFKKYPFNEYIYGMHHCMESELEATQRRDRMLNHLMARHGDDALVYDAMLKTCQWYGSELKTRIIVKSIWLQNYQLLSYRRTCAHDFMAARSLGTPGRYCITTQIFNDFALKQAGSVWQNGLYGLIETGFSSPAALRQHLTRLWTTDGASQNECTQWLTLLTISDRNQELPPLRIESKVSQAPQPWWLQPLPATVDGELDQRKIFSQTQLQPSDFANFSTFEIKLGILLGLPQHYLNLAAKLLALLENSDFLSWLSAMTSSQGQTNYYLPHSDISILRQTGKDQLFEGTQCLMDIVSTSAATRADYQAHVDQLIWLARERKGFFLVEPVLWLAGMASAKWPQDQFLSAVLVFPAYITLIQQPGFTQFLHTLLRLHWPAHVHAKCLPLTLNLLKAIIPVFVGWQNSLHQASPPDIWPTTLAKLLFATEGHHAG